MRKSFPIETKQPFQPQRLIVIDSCLNSRTKMKKYDRTNEAFGNGGSHGIMIQKHCHMRKRIVKESIDKFYLELLSSPNQNT